MSLRELTPFSAATDTILVFAASGNNFYLCRAAPGTATSEAAWRIAYFTDDGSGNYTFKWAGGTPAYVNIADNRASYTYS